MNNFIGLVFGYGKAQAAPISAYAIRADQEKNGGRNAEEGEMTSFENDKAETLITLTSDIVAAHVSNNNVSVDEVPALIRNGYGARAGVDSAPGVGV